MEICAWQIVSIVFNSTWATELSRFWLARIGVTGFRRHLLKNLMNSCTYRQRIIRTNQPKDSLTPAENRAETAYNNTKNHCPMGLNQSRQSNTIAADLQYCRRIDETKTVRPRRFRLPSGDSCRQRIVWFLRFL
jgi:hypothetical protein